MSTDAGSAEPRWVTRQTAQASLQAFSGDRAEKIPSYALIIGVDSLFS